MCHLHTKFAFTPYNYKDMTPSVHTSPLEIAGLSHPGQVRSLNEDTWATASVTAGEIMIVADGMGGHRTGEVASQMATQTLVEALSENRQTPPEGLPKALQKANLAVYQHASKRSESRGMGTTMTALVVDGNAAIIGHVGDSRAYLIRGTLIQQLTRDHSWVAERVRQGVISEEEARNHRWRNVITNALGSRPQLRLDLFGIELREGDTILLCSDGLSNMLNDDMILSMVQRNQDDPAEVVAQKLIDAANANGGPDNITVLLTRVKKLGKRSKNYVLPQLGREPAMAVPDLEQDPNHTIILEPTRPVPFIRKYWLPIVAVAYVLVFVALFLSRAKQ